jgi:hypothetical protein
VVLGPHAVCVLWRQALCLQQTEPISTGAVWCLVRCMFSKGLGFGAPYDARSRRGWGLVPRMMHVLEAPVCVAVLPQSSCTTLCVACGHFAGTGATFHGQGSTTSPSLHGRSRSTLTSIRVASATFYDTRPTCEIVGVNSPFSCSGPLLAAPASSVSTLKTRVFDIADYFVYNLTPVVAVHSTEFHEGHFFVALQVLPFAIAVASP